MAAVRKRWRTSTRVGIGGVVRVDRAGQRGEAVETGGRDPPSQVAFGRPAQLVEHRGGLHGQPASRVVGQRHHPADLVLDLVGLVVGLHEGDHRGTEGRREGADELRGDGALVEDRHRWSELGRAGGAVDVEPVGLAPAPCPAPGRCGSAPGGSRDRAARRHGCCAAARARLGRPPPRGTSAAPPSDRGAAAVRPAPAGAAGRRASRLRQIASIWVAIAPKESTRNARPGCTFARSWNQESLGITQVMVSGSTSWASSHRQASIPVLPAPTTTYLGGGAASSASALIGTQVTCSSTS